LPACSGDRQSLPVAGGKLYGIAGKGGRIAALLSPFSADASGFRVRTMPGMDGAMGVMPDVPDATGT